GELRRAPNAEGADGLPGLDGPQSTSAGSGAGRRCLVESPGSTAPTWTEAQLPNPNLWPKYCPGRKQILAV
ncbi:hypothetical protein AB0H48_02260, partial [Streptomyces globisporus]